MKRQPIVFMLTGFMLLMSACTAKRYIPEDRQLFTGYEVVFDSTNVIEDQKKLKKEILGLLSPNPNFSFLGMRPGLWLYYQVEDTAAKGFKGFIKNKLGSPPVYADHVDGPGTSEMLESWLENKGFFEREVSWALTDTGKTTDIQYLVSVAPPYTIEILEYLGSDSTIADKEVLRVFNDQESLVRLGCPYSLDALIQERVRISDTLRNNGFYYFTPDYLLFQLDTAEEGSTTKLYLKIKENTPEKALIPYTISDITVHSAFKMGEDTLSGGVVEGDRGIKFIYYDSTFRAKPILRAITIAPGMEFNREEHERTLGRLISIGAFRLVDIKYTPLDTTGSGKLKADIFLSPMIQHTLRSELSLVTKSNNFTGPGLNFSYRNRSLLRGGELLVLSATAGYEVQFGGNSSNSLNSYEFTVNSDLYIPRSISLFKAKRHVNNRMPRTHYRVGGTMLSRLGYFSMYGFNGSYGYRWTPRPTVSQEISPFTLSYVNVFRTSDEFDKILGGNPVLARSFEKQFIIGPEYSVTFNNQQETEDFVTFHAAFTAGESGFLTGFFSPEIAGIPVSQYIRSDVDFRQYWKVATESRLVTRFFAGAGIPFGNSSIMPYMKQYFSGGANSIRAFPARTVGPGSYTAPDSLYESIFLDQSGDIKLEANIEYRFPINNILKGALFVDAGNVWLLNEDPGRPGSGFNIGDVTTQLAAGYGFGLRIDVTFFVLRFDLGIPWLRPYNAGDAPVPHQQNGVLGDMVLNIAIGYPF